MENNEEIKDQEISEDFQDGGVQQWLQDNLRIIISVLIVVVIAGGIYSYSKRSETPVASDNTIQQDDTIEKIAGADSKDQSIDNSDQPAKTEEKAAANDKTADNNSQTAQAAQEEDKQAQAKQDTQVKPADQVSSTSTSQETDKSFVETAAKGDNTTKLARRALANYLEKNPDSALTAEHKIYIEDYLRKSAKGGKVTVGTSVEFQKSLIDSAISKAKNLNSNQLKNLHKYAVRVPSLS